MDGIAAQLEKSFPETNRGWRIRVVPLADEVLSGVRPVLLLLMAAAAFVLLIACVNVAVLLTFNAVTRFQEAAVRMAIGASAPRSDPAVHDRRFDPDTVRRCGRPVRRRDR
jgi:putative ABC transport system permease protein